MISSDLYIFSLPSISACHGQVAVHIRALIVGCVIWLQPKYTAGFPQEARRIFMKQLRITPVLKV